jgi:hypothetical protein
MKKKGAGDVLKIIVWFAIISVMGFGIIRWFTDTIAHGADTTLWMQIENKHKLCEAAGKKALEEGKEPEEEIEGEEYKDNFPDYCDICLGGNNNDVEEGWIPKACYYDKAKLSEKLHKKTITYKDMCRQRGCYISSTFQCCLTTKDIKCPC